ncbi:hypothetical protein ACIHDR_43380 [Nocardia sp. NPDC052278]|uniref:hypothetical protein n=1 Tax=unclassified Nocardia TaxID=2637762 RepID=UPI0036BCB361
MTIPNRPTATALLALASTAALGVTVMTGCSVHRSDTSAPAEQAPVEVHAPPTRLRWTSFQGMELPVADQGPKLVNGAVATGFDYTPTGAGLAAIHASVRMSVATDTQWPLVGQQMLAPGPGRDAWALTRAQISITSEISTGAPQVLGYLIRHYTPQAADIAIYTRQADASLTRNNVTVLWQSGDWRLLVEAQPTTPTVAAIDATPVDMVALSEQ